MFASCADKCLTNDKLQMPKNIFLSCKNTAYPST